MENNIIKTEVWQINEPTHLNVHCWIINSDWMRCKSWHCSSTLDYEYKFHIDLRAKGGISGIQIHHFHTSSCKAFNVYCDGHQSLFCIEEYNL